MSGSSQTPRYGAPGGEPPDGALPPRGDYPSAQAASGSHTQQANYPGGQPPHGYYPVAPPPETPRKKKHTLRNIILALLLLCILGFVACSALVVSSVDDAVTKSEQADKAPGGSDNPLKVTEGEQFAVGKWKAEQGWSVKKSFLGYHPKIDVTNTSKETDTVFFTMKLLAGSRVIASIDCNTGELEPGQTEKANCIPDGEVKKSYRDITVENTF